MIKIHELRKHPKSTKRRKVVGRGIGSGKGTYSGRGGKGQTARTGHSKMPAGFEGGRTPLIRQLPKSRGFRAIDEKAIAISVDRLNVFEDGTVVTVKLLMEKGIVYTTNKKQPRVKLLKGDLKKKLTVKVASSSSAKAAIEKAGGTLVVR